MAEFTLPANSKIGVGTTHKAPPNAKQQCVIFTWLDCGYEKRICAGGG